MLILLHSSLLELPTKGKIAIRYWLRVVTPTTAGQLGSDLSAWFKTKDIVHGCFGRMKKDRLK